MFLEDFSSEPIAMCKILLYVESIEIHIAGENDMKRLVNAIKEYRRTANIPKGEYSLSDLLK